MLTVNCEGNTIYDRGIDYAVVPHVSRPFNCTEFTEEERSDALNERIADMDPDFIYFSAHERAFEDIGTYRLPERYECVAEIPGLYRRVSE